MQRKKLFELKKKIQKTKQIPKKFWTNPEVEQSQRLYKFRIRKKFENPNERQRHSEKNENSNKAKVCTNPEFETKIQNRKQTLKKF